MKTAEPLPPPGLPPPGLPRLEWLLAAWQSDFRRMEAIAEAAWLFSELSAVPQPGEDPAAVAAEAARQDREMLALREACLRGRAELAPKMADLSLLVEEMRAEAAQAEAARTAGEGGAS